MKKLLPCGVLFFMLVTAVLAAGIQDVQNKLNSKDYQGAIDAAKAIVVNPQSSIHDKAVAQCFIGEGYANLQDNKTAAVEYQKVIDTYPSEKSVHYDPLRGLFQSQYALNNWTEFLAVCNKLITDYPKSGQANFARWYIPQVYSYMKQYDKSLEYLKKTEDLYLVAPTATGSLQYWITNVSIDADKEDALLQAKLFFDVCDLQYTQDAINKVCQMLKNADLNLKRVNQYLQFQKDGTGTNPVADVKVSADRVAFLESMAAKCANDYDGVRNQAYLYLMAGEPQKALPKAKKAFGLATMQNMNQCVMDIAICLKAMDGNIIRANKYIEAQKKGEDFPLP
jgi:tetratricopeptide (TPR) repeat protein